jgi:hypothetical protein
MRHSIHFRKTIKRHGEAFESVHQRLDETALGMGYAHRRDTHHLEFVFKMYEEGRWNERQCAVALEHIMDDCGCIMVKGDWSG